MLGYVIAVASMAGVCLLAIAPPMPSESSPSHWTYAAGAFLVNELPFVALFWLTLWTVQAAAGGHLDGPVGVGGLGLALLAVVEVGVIARRGLAARAQLASALDSTFGSPLDCSSGVGHRPSQRMPSGHPWLRILLAPLSFRGRQVRRTANVRYGDAGRHHLLDVYHHRTHRGRPVLVYFHGGGFRSGHKNREARPLLHRLARQGWVCISANYRLAPEAGTRDQLGDAKRALAWARHHAAGYGGDPSRIYVAGSSAGGHLATMCALTPNHEAFRPECVEADTVVAGAISLYGFYGSPGDHRRVPSSPRAHLHADAPPMFIAHGDLDTIVLVDDARTFVHDLATVSSNPVVYAELAGAHHAFDLFRSARFEAVVDAIEQFLIATTAD